MAEKSKPNAKRPEVRVFKKGTTVTPPKPKPIDRSRLTELKKA